MIDVECCLAGLCGDWCHECLAEGLPLPDWCGLAGTAEQAGITKTDGELA